MMNISRECGESVTQINCACNEDFLNIMSKFGEHNQRENIWRNGDI
jgi:hypothetical protein